MAAVGDPRGYYSILGLDRTASAADIKTAFRERAKRYHPDGSSMEGNEQRFHALREAYEVLRDPRQRLRYDAAGLAGERARDPRVEPPPGPSGPWWTAAGLKAALARIGPHRLILALLALALLTTLGLLGSAWSRLSSRDRVIADLTHHLEGTGAHGADGRELDAAAGRVSVYGTQLAFPEGKADLDRSVQQSLERIFAELRQAIAGLPADSTWTVLVEGSSAQAANAQGVLIEGWKLALLRVGVTLEYLIRQGVPAERLAVGFRAGLPASVAPLRAEVVELNLVCCTGSDGS